MNFMISSVLGAESAPVAGDTIPFRLNAGCLFPDLKHSRVERIRRENNSDPLSLCASFFVEKVLTQIAFFWSFEQARHKEM